MVSQQIHPITLQGTHSFTPYSKISSCFVPMGKTRSKVKPSFSGPDEVCADLTTTVWRFSSKETTISPPSLASIAFTGRNLRNYVLLECIQQSFVLAHRQTTLMFVELAIGGSVRHEQSAVIQGQPAEGYAVQWRSGYTWGSEGRV